MNGIEYEEVSLYVRTNCKILMYGSLMLRFARLNGAILPVSKVDSAEIVHELPSCTIQCISLSLSVFLYIIFFQA